MDFGKYGHRKVMDFDGPIIYEPCIVEINLYCPLMKVSGVEGCSVS